MADVFVSYASPDRERVAPIVGAIEAEGWSVWWDRAISGGEAFDRAIERAIDEARCVVVVWSAESVESEWVRTEANEGLERGILIPVAIDDVRPPLAFRRTHTIDLRATSKDVDSLIRAVAGLCPRDFAGGRAQSACIGRDVELARITDALTRACDGFGSLILLSGEAGVGKTRVTREVAALAHSLGALALTGHCSEMEGVPPYEPFIEHIEQAVRIVDPVRLWAALGENAPEVAKLMPELRQLYPDIQPAIELPPDQDRRYLLHGFGEFIERSTGGQPLLLVFENLHWGDDSTCIMLRHLAGRLRNSAVLLLGTYRDNELAPGSPFARILQELVRERLAEEIHLQRLDRDAVSKLLSSRAGRAPPEQLLELVFLETEGNPFFVEEVYRYLEESGKLFDANGAFQADINIADTDVPRGVRLVLEQRIQRVSDNCRKVLTAGAVCGRMFGFELLLRIGGADEDTLLDVLDEATASSLLEDFSSGREASYQFAHELIRQTLLGALSLPRRQRLHLRIGDALEQLFGDSRASEIAHHYYQSGAAADSEKTLAYLQLAGARALDALAFEDALRQLDLALELAQESAVATVAQIESKRAFALRGAARVADALIALAVALEHKLPDDDYERLLFQRAQLLVDLYRGAEALPDIQTLLDRAKTRGDQAMALEAQRLLTEAHYRISLDTPESVPLAREASDATIALARSVGDRRTLAAALLTSTHFVDYFQDYREQGMKNLEEARQIGVELHDEEIEIDAATMGLRLNPFSAMDLAQAAEGIRERLEARRDPIRLKEHLFWMIGVTRTVGQLERSVEVSDRALEVAARLGVAPVQYPTFKALALINLGRFGEAWRSIEVESDDEKYRFGRALQALGFLFFKARMGAADMVLEQAPMLLEETYALHRVWMYTWIIDLVAATGARGSRLEATRQFLQRALALTGIKPGYSARAEIELAAGEFDAALALALRSVEYQQARELPVPRAEAVEVALRVLLALERWEEMIERLEDVIEFANGCKYADLQWRLYALRALAREALGDSDQASHDRFEGRLILTHIAASIEDTSLKQSYESQSLAQGLLA